MYHEENFEKTMQYGKFGCRLIGHNYDFKISYFLHKHNDIISVEGSSIVL